MGILAKASHFHVVHGFCLFLLLATQDAQAADTVTLRGRASVIDGDTIEIHGRRIRLFGIDAVESGQRCERNGKPWLCGRDSAFALADKISQRPIECAGDEFDRYKRLIARCFLNGEDLNGWMVENGWAVAFRRYSEQYIGQETRARNKQLGLWSGAFDMPWDWRGRKQNGRTIRPKPPTIQPPATVMGAPG